MYTIIGLGNPGDDYNNTPHNVGFEFIDYFFKKNDNIFLSKREDKKKKAFIVKSIENNVDFIEPVEILFPKVFMNNSGQCLVEFKKENNNKKGEFKNLIVIQDDIDLPFGKIKIVYNSGHGGHNGVRDIIRVLGSNKFIRIKFGVGIVDNDGNVRKPRGEDGVSNYLVYRKMTKKNREVVEKSSEIIEKILKEIIKKDLNSAMNKFNGK